MLQAALAHAQLGIQRTCRVMFVRREVPVGKCIPDIVYVSFANVPQREVWPSQWSYRHAFVVWLLRRRSPLHSSTIAARCYEPLSRVEPVIQDLLASGTLARKHTGSLSLAPAMRKMRVEVTAAEAKLHRWRNGLRQAAYYRRFADRVFVGLNTVPSSMTEDSLHKFRQSRVGLCVVTPRTLQWLVKPEKSITRPGPEWEYLVGAAVRDNQSLWSIRKR